MVTLQEQIYIDETTCRACGSSNLETIIEFGDTPLADRLLRQDQLSDPELSAPLTLVFCPESALVQIKETVKPEVLFYSEYPYFSSVSPSLLRHFGDSAQHIMETRPLDENSLVIEAASNDGYMLRNFHEKGIPVQGIDPSEAPVAAAREKGIPTMCDFFGKDLAAQLAAEGKKADVFLANNVLAHVPDLNGFVTGIRTILKDTGVAVIEAPYLVDLVDHCEFDTIYHQHLCYFSVTALDRLFRSHDLYLNDIKRTAIHGGSLRLFIEPTENVQKSVTDLLEMEIERKVDKIDYYKDFAERVQKVRNGVMNIVTELKSQGKSIVGYGAAAKACTMLAYCGLTTDHLDYVLDLNTYKHSRYMGGNRLHIRPTETLLQEQPDYALILAWNFAKEIMEQQDEYRQAGGKFIVPIPTPQVIE